MLSLASLPNSLIYSNSFSAVFIYAIIPYANKFPTFSGIKANKVSI